MSVKFKPTQIAMPLSANYGRWYAKMVPTDTNTSHQLAEEVAHSSTVLNLFVTIITAIAATLIVFCYIVTLLHVTLRSFHNARCIR